MQQFLLDQRTTRQILVSSISMNEQRDDSVPVDDSQSPIYRRNLKQKNDQPVNRNDASENDMDKEPSPQQSEYPMEARTINKNANKENDNSANIVEP